MENDGIKPRKSKWDGTDDLCPDDIDGLADILSDSLCRSLDKMEKELKEE